MPTGLNSARVVNVSVDLSPTLPTYRNFGDLVILGSSNVIDTSERIREYDGLDAIATAYGTLAPEFLASSLFFSQDPPPRHVYLGRWAQTATAGILHGAILTPLQQLIANYQAVTAGALFIVVDGVPYALTGLNFSGATNLNGVASILQTALQAAGATGARVLWGSINSRFDVISGTTGTASSVSYGQAPTATDKVTFTAIPTAGSNLPLNGSALTFVASAPTGNQALIGGTLAATLANAAQAINSSTDAQIGKFTAFATATTLYLWADLPGAAGNALTVTASTAPASNGTVATPTLVGGSGTDVSVLLGLSATPNGTGGSANVPVPGLAAESLVSAVSALANVSSAWYGCIVATAVPPADNDHLATAAFIEGSTLTRTYGITTQNTNVLDPTRSDDICSVLQSLGYERTFTQYSSSNPYAVTSMFARAATVNYEGINTTLTLKFKQEPGVAAEYLTASQASALEAKNCNVFVNYDNASAILEQGVMANGYFFDERQGADALQNALSIDLFNLLKGSFTKVPQTDDGQNLLITQCYATAGRFITNGWIAPAIWYTGGFGTLVTGQKLKTGVYFYSDSFDLQSQTDRVARKAMPIQGAVTLAGAIHSINCAVQVNR